LTNEEEKHGSADLPERELRQLMKGIEEAPISEELRILAKKLEHELKEQNQLRGED
jgi:hypothetical protein